MPSGKTIPIIAFAGRANSGKTTLIEKVVSAFAKQGLRVTVIKHTHHPIDVDVPGKDTHRHTRAGAKTVILASPARLAMVKDTPGGFSLDDIITRYVDDADLVIVEGFKSAPVPKIEVYTRSSGEAPLYVSGDSLYIALATDDDLDAAIPKFKRDDAEAIAGFISMRILKGNG